MTTLSKQSDEATSATLLDVRAVAQLLDCSTRHVYRMADSGKMPAPVRIGALVRWTRQSLESWIGGGCKPIVSGDRS
jgi:excisionase family DNA binding protein